MKKYFYPLPCVLLHVITVIGVLRFCTDVIGLNIVADLKKITIYIMIISSFELFSLGFLISMKSKIKIIDIIIMSLINAVLLFVVSLLNFKILDIPLSLIDTFSFKGLFFISIFRGDSLGSLGIWVYLFYYIMMFNIGIVTYKLMENANKTSKT